MTQLAPGVRTIGDLVVTSRSLAEYRDMFLLTDDDLTAGPILDCPGGASPFGAQVRARGGSVVSVDPVYLASRAELSERIRRDLRHQSTWLTARSAQFDWSYMGSPASLVRHFDLAAEMFLADYTSDNRRYVAAALPTLPFPDGTFRLTLSGHLLFCYADRLSYPEHVAGILELMRVTRDELRIYPLVDTAGRSFHRLTDLRATLAEHGVATEIRPANCCYVQGSDQLMSCRWRRTG